MMGRQVAQGSLFYGFRLDDHVPADHLLRRIDGLLDLGFARGALAASYSATGRPSVDPELMLRMLLIGYLFGIRSERRLCEEVVTRCAVAGLVAGREVAVDGSTILADASWEKKLPGATAADELRAREAVSRPVTEYLAALDAALPPEPGQPAPVEPTHVSPTDPQAAFTCKHGPGRFAYAINPLLDLDTDCILDVEATPARFSAEVAATRTLVSRVRNKLGIAPASLAADKAYGNGPLLGWLIGQNITPYVPVIDRSRQRDGFFTRDAFRYDAEADAYRCPADKPLTYRGTVRASQVRRYRSHASDCAGCPLKPRCTTARHRAVTRLVDEDARDQICALAGTEAYNRARQRRKRIERVFGHLKRNLKLRTLKLRGLAGAAEQFTMGAAAYNLQLLARRVAPA